jgi:hypothetical protein
MALSKIQIPHLKNKPSSNNQYILPPLLLTYLTTTFHLTHSYFSSQVTCPTNIHKYYSPFPCDIVFGSISTSFQYKCIGSGFAHPLTDKETQQALHWARLPANANPSNITILTTTDNKWYQNHNPLANPFPNTHLIAQIPLDTITYDKPTILTFQNMEPRIELNILNIYYIYNKQITLTCHKQLMTFQHILDTLSISHTHLQTVSPTPPGIRVNSNKIWDSFSYPSSTNPPTNHIASSKLSH